MTTKPSAPVVGFNHNVKYGPRVYHVQTEDSGLPHAHYITHLFVGGNIVASMKSSYAEQAGDPELHRLVRGLMESQHKTMLKRLVTGEFDEMAGRLAAPHYEPGVLADGTQTASYVNSGGASAPARPAAAKPAPQAPRAAPAARPAPGAAPQVERRAPPPAPVWQAAPPSASPSSPRTPGSPLPSVTRGPAQPTRPTAPPRMAPVAAPARGAPATAPPAAPSFFSESAVEMPHEDLPTLFAEELISEKSLDEVILAFLSADLEPPK